MASYVDINPRFKNNNLIGYDLETEEDAVKNSLLNIFLINKGEVPGKPWFGNPMNISLFDLFNFFTQTNMETAIKSVVAQYEPRVRLHNVVIVEAEEYNRIIIQLEYSFVVENSIVYSSLELPFSHNTVSFLGGRIRPVEPESVVGSCVLNI